jgi:DNA-binding NarL/FixJ family response regulator
MKIKTVIIDDHMLFNDGLGLILKDSGHFEIIGQIYDSRQAYFKCYSLMPQLIILDYNMPYINGLEVLKQLKTLKSGAKIVIISMYAEKREISLFEEVGVDAYVTKTTPANELIIILQKVMQGEKIFESSFNHKPIIDKDAFTLKHNLTKREIEILKLVKIEYTTQQIASSLNLSYFTVETHRKNVNNKMKFKTKKDFYDFLQNF